MSSIEWIELKNFKRFHHLKIENLDSQLNILAGDNESGKSTVLLAIDLIMSGSVGRVENIGLENIFNKEAIKKFENETTKTYQMLPELQVDVHLKNDGRHELDGKHTMDNQDGYGLCLKCSPNPDYQAQIEELIAQDPFIFPYEFYKIEIKLFSGSTVTRYNRPGNVLMVDSSRIGNQQATRYYIQNLFSANTDVTNRAELQYDYRTHKNNFNENKLKNIGTDLDDDLAFTLRNDVRYNLENSISISKNQINIENLGAGRQCFIRAEFALSKKSKVDVVLLEEPENHLSHQNMNLLIDLISNQTQSQLFVSTHNSLIASRLDLRKAILLSAMDTQDHEPIAQLSDLTEDTAKFFTKDPKHNLLEFALSRKCILVEGDAEYLLMAKMYNIVTNSTLEADGIGLISVGGVKFLRYLEIAKLLKIKAAVITDNDKDFGNNITQKYEGYGDEEDINVFAESDDKISTFEISLYQTNSELCERLFSKGRRTLSVQDYMLKNKTEAAYQLLLAEDSLTIPNYIEKAIEWIKS